MKERAEDEFSEKGAGISAGAHSGLGEPDDDDVPFTADARLEWDPLIQEARATKKIGGEVGPREFFWGTVAPLTVVACFSVAVVLFLVSVWLLGADVQFALKVGLVAAGVSGVVLLLLQYYLVRTGIEGPLRRLSYELLGRLPWRPERDVLFVSLRRAVENVRDGAFEAREKAEHAEERVRELEERLNERRAGESLMFSAAEAVTKARTVGEYGTAVADVLRKAWPAEEVVVLRRDEVSPDLHVVYRGAAAGGQDATMGSEGPAAISEGPGYPKTNLPRPVKDALRKGVAAEYGGPIGLDPNLPRARSFVAMALDHKGAAAGVVLLATSEQRPPEAEPIKKIRALLSLGFSRVLLSQEREEAVIRDGLTGLYTHDHFLSVIRSEIARCNRYSREASCLVLDIDGLNTINERHGAGAGDKVIVEVARVVQELVRGTDVVARSGGGRIEVLLPETGLEAAHVAAGRIREKVEEHPFILGANQVERVTVSGGIGVHPPQGVTAFSLIDAAEETLERAKKNGRNCIRGPELPETGGAGTELNSGPGAPPGSRPGG